MLFLLLPRLVFFRIPLVFPNVVGTSPQVANALRSVLL